ncbi:uncharacterized protein HPF210_0662 [Helicobacter pylori]|nr:hypothetical protein [Helicobacter pylori]BAW43981.1 uncharacterized protein HPF210_0662 [Helicobacter pylori]
MYAHIDRNIEDDECKRKFEYELQQGMKELDRTIQGLVKKCEEQFRKDIQKAIEQLKERIKDSLVMLDRINIIDSGFDFSFSINSGIDKIGLLASIGGLALLLMTPAVGLIALIGGLILGAIGVVKSLWSFLVQTIKNPNKEKKWIRI